MTRPRIMKIIKLIFFDLSKSLIHVHVIEIDIEYSKSCMTFLIFVYS